jgi:hypothetical protein
MTTFANRFAPTADSSVTLKAVRPAKTSKGGKVKRFLNTLMRSLASAHA